MIAATSAMAPAFTHTPPDSPVWDVAFTDGLVGGILANLAAGTYRMWLAPSAGCYLRCLVAAINAALIAEGATNRVSASISGAGVATLTFTEDTAALDLSPSVARVLGMSTTNVLADNRNCVGSRPVWYLALFASLAGYAPLPKQQGGAEVDGAGVVYTFANGATSWRQTAEAALIPWTPTMRVAQGCEGTAMYPAEGYLGALGAVDTAREWSLLDVLRVSRNALCGVALGNWQALRTSTTAPVWRSYVAPATLLSPEIKRAEKSVEVWCELELALTHPSTPTETRA